MMRAAIFVSLLVGAVLLAEGCAVSTNPVSGRRRLYGYSWEEERRIGQEADRQIVAQYGLYEDPKLAAYVDSLGQVILQHSHLRRPETPAAFRNTPFVFRVLDSPIVNAFALPGGYIYVTRGLLAHVNNEAQLAVVLGHEIGHVAARHASQRAFELQLGQVALLGGAIVGQEVLGLPGGDVLQLGGTVAQLLFLKYSRDDERESDRLGVEYAARAGYDAAEAAAFFSTLKRLSEQAGANLPSFLSTHPDPGEREQTIRALAARWRTELPAMDRVLQAAYYTRIEGLVLGEDPRQGYLDGQAFYHPTLRFWFPVPTGFHVTNQPSQVILTDHRQEAVLVLSLASETSAAAAAQRWRGQQGLTLIDQGSERINGLTAVYVVAEGKTSDGQLIRVLRYFIEHEGRVYSFAGYALQAHYARYQPTFLQAIRGFAPLRDPVRLNVQPIRLRVVRAARSAPFRVLLPELPRGFTPETVAILNQVTLEAPISSGTPLKLPQP
ncbi:M48 family metalloprotease [Rhodothermus bifroesti]|jgi:predicted Zn-dependent protease|uniref:Peptidase M48 n=1 Tax=Rhodothermus marinus TaxID=29549 RepID=A0A7V2B204_RHOMR|nr:M48 family metalloprotease [Rhodothermus bifroesti]GBD00461.1 Beta-barrel assembly-enhancing protease [bacterium HR18]